MKTGYCPLCGFPIKDHEKTVCFEKDNVDRAIFKCRVKIDADTKQWTPRFGNINEIRVVIK